MSKELNYVEELLRKNRVDTNRMFKILEEDIDQLKADLLKYKAEYNWFNPTGVNK